MTTPRPEHVDAVARALAINDVPDLDIARWWDMPEDKPGVIERETREEYRANARAILTDPALVPALLDALTRHGVLTEEVMNKPIFRERTLDPTEVRMVGQNGDATVVYVERWADQRRFVTPWEVSS